MTDVCRACKAPIIWARSEHGRPMPLDLEPDPAGNIATTPLGTGGLLAVVVPAGVLERLDDEHRAQMRKSHFATCPWAGDFRRPR
jgi:hypothetical protein